MGNNSKELSFEEALKQLENIVNALEKEDVALDKMIRYYEKGMELSKQCSDMLANAEEKMTKIINDQGKIENYHTGEEL